MGRTEDRGVTKNTGVTTSAIEVAPWKARKLAKKRRQQEKEWAEKCGPVTVYFREPEPK